MKNIVRIVTLTVVVAFLSTTFLSAQEHNHNHKDDKNKVSEKMMEMKKIDKNKDGVIFECPMKCEAPKDAPGECSKCGMELKKISMKDMMKKNGKMMDHKKMNHNKNMKENKEMMNTKMKGMKNMKIGKKEKMQMKTLETK